MPLQPKNTPHKLGMGTLYPTGKSSALTGKLTQRIGLPPESLFLHPCTEEETIKATKKLSMKKSKGPDDIPCFILFKNVDILARVITHCINYTFETGIFPTCLKEALVIPIYKKKCRTLPTNYRPVSLLNALSKIVEKS